MKYSRYNQFGSSIASEILKVLILHNIEFGRRCVIIHECNVALVSNVVDKAVAEGVVVCGDVLIDSISQCFLICKECNIFNPLSILNRNKYVQQAHVYIHIYILTPSGVLAYPIPRPTPLGSLLGEVG